MLNVACEEHIHHDCECTRAVVKERACESEILDQGWFFPLIIKQYEGMLRGLTITEGHCSNSPVSLDLRCIPKSFRFVHLAAGMLTDPRSESVWSGTFFSLCKPNSGFFCLQQFSILEWADKHFNGMVKMQGPGGRKALNGEWWMSSGAGWAAGQHHDQGALPASAVSCKVP